MGVVQRSRVWEDGRAARVAVREVEGAEEVGEIAPVLWP